MSRESYDRMVARIKAWNPKFVPPPFEESGFVTTCKESEDRARQEFKNESDTEYQVRRFGAGVPFQVGFQDDTLDLLQSMQLVDESARAWARLPQKVRDRYKNWLEVERAAQTGELQDLLKPPADAGGGSPAAGGGSPSESAAGGGTAGA